MASILRSSKFVRYIAGFARNVVLNTPREFDGNFVNTTQCYCGSLQRSLANASQASVQLQHEQGLERRLRSLDHDVRRSGRISRRDIEDVLEEIRTNRNATSSQSLLVIRCCGNLVPDEMPETRTKLVQEIWNTLIKLNVPMDISHYNALLRVYLENEHPFSPIEFLSELESKGIEPNRVTYQRLIAKYCQNGDIEGATRILEFMKEKLLPVNESVFNALIMGHSQAGDMESAKGILPVMSQAGLEPSADTYTTLLCGYAKRGDIESMQKIYEECEQKEILLLDKDYLDIIYALATNGHGEHVPDVLSKLRKSIGFNQDAINLIYRLINKGHEDTAFVVLKAMDRSEFEGNTRPHGTFFIKQLVKANRPFEKVIEYSQKLENEGFYMRGLYLATEMALELGNEALAYPLLSALRERGQEIRQHFFWPLLVAKGDSGDTEALIDVLNRMRDEFELIPSHETLREYVLPRLHGSGAEILSLLRRANVSVGSAACSLAVHLLQKGSLEEAATIMGGVQAYYHPELIKKPLSSAFAKSGYDVNGWIKVVRNVWENLEKRRDVSESEVKERKGNVRTKEEAVGELLLDLANSPRQFGEVVEKLLEGLVKEGLSITTEAADKLQNKLGEKMTEKISDLLSKLTSGELTPVPISNKKLPSYVPSSQMNIPQLERLIHNLSTKNQDTKNLKKQLLIMYCKAKDVENVDKLLPELGENLEMTEGVLANLIDVYACNGRIAETEGYLQQLKEMTPDFTLDDLKILHVVQMYVKHGKIDEAIKFLDEVKSKKFDPSFTYSTTAWRILNALAEEKKPEELTKIYEALERSGLIEPSNVLLGPLVKVHVLLGDLDKALEVFEWCCLKYKATPLKNELTCKLIEQEDAEKLQKLTDLSTAVHGEINSLYDLVFAFVECGRIRQARKILETPGLHVRPGRINSVCEHYRQEGMIKELEGLKAATKDLNHIDRSDIYQQLLLSYVKQEDVDKALGLWTQMQEEDMAPTDNFLITLGNFLKANNVKVPFVIPYDSKVTKQQVQIQEQPSPAVPTLRGVAKSKMGIFRDSLRSGNLDKALDVYKSGGDFSISDTSVLIEKLLQNDRLNDATKITLQMLDRGVHPLQRVFRFLLNKLATSGNVDVLERIGSQINPELKKLVSFDNRICHANVVAGNIGEYLKNLEKAIENAKPEEVLSLSEQFPRGGANGILEKYPEHVEKYKQIALKYVAHGIVSPINVLWAHYFIKGEDEEAEKIWKEHLQNAPRIMFQRVVQAARDKQDEKLTRKLIDHLKVSKVTEGAIGNAYSCLLDIIVAKEKPEKVVESFEAALKDVDVGHLNRTAVIRVKQVYEGLGKKFEYKVPARAEKGVGASMNTTSSSSEDEKKK